MFQKTAQTCSELQTAHGGVIYHGLHLTVSDEARLSGEERKKKKKLTSQTYPMRREHREKEKGSVYHSELERLRAYVIMEECFFFFFLTLSYGEISIINRAAKLQNS